MKSCVEKCEGTYYPAAHTQTAAYLQKEHMLNHHWSFPGNKKKTLCGLNPPSWTLEKCRVQLLQEKKERGESLSWRQRREESEVDGSGLWYGRRKASRCEEDRPIKERSHQRRKREKGPTNWQREVRVSLLCISFTRLAVSTNRIGSGARGLGWWIKTPNAFTALIPLSHNTLSAPLFSHSLSFLSSLS